MASVVDFAAWRMFRMVFESLEGIQKATGYNFDPAVTDDFNEWETATADAVLWLEVESIDPVEAGVGGGSGPRLTVELTFALAGLVRYDKVGMRPRMAAMALEQDARRAIHGSLASIKTYAGRGFHFEFGPSQHDAGFLAPDREAGFRLTFTFRFSQGSEW